MAGDQGVEEMPQAGQARRDVVELEMLILAPGEEAPHDAGIGVAGMGIGDACREELIGGKPSPNWRSNCAYRLGMKSSSISTCTANGSLGCSLDVLPAQNASDTSAPARRNRAAHAFK